MADLLTGVDFVADFERWAQGLELVTVRSIDGITGATLASKGDVKAAKLIRKRETTPARGGSVWVDSDEVWVVTRDLGFTLKTVDQIVRANGEAFTVKEVGEVVAGLARCQVTKVRA